MNAEQMERHVEELAMANMVNVKYYKGRGRAFRGGVRTIYLRPIKGISTYYVALHELGHIVGKGRSGRKLEREAAAWVYALDVAKRPPTQAVRRMIARCLGSYVHAGRRDWGYRQNMVEPSADHVLWRLLEEGDSDLRPLSA